MASTRRKSSRSTESASIRLKEEERNSAGEKVNGKNKHKHNGDKSDNRLSTSSSSRGDESPIDEDLLSASLSTSMK